MEGEVIAAVVTGIVAVLTAVGSYLYKAYRERKVINKAILAEIQRLLSVLTQHKNWWDRCINEKNTDYPLIPFRIDVYNSQVGKIGIVDKSIIVFVVKFYGYIEYINKLQSVRNEYKDPAKFDWEYKRSLDAITEDYTNKFDNAFKKYKVAGGDDAQQKSAEEFAKNNIC